MVTIVEYLSAVIKDKPLDGSDVQTLAEAQAELGRLRRINHKLCQLIANSSQATAAAGTINTSHPQATNVMTRVSSNGSMDSSRGKRKTKRQALKIDESYKEYKKVVVKKSKSDRELLRNAIRTNPLFEGSTAGDLEEFIDVFEKKRFLAGSTVIRQGDEGDAFYVVDEGSLDIFINAGGHDMKVGAPCTAGSSFGELALIYGSPRAATIRATKDCVLWQITRTAFKGIQLQNEQRERLEILQELRKVKIGEKFFADVMSTDQLESIALSTHHQAFEKGDVIVREGEKGDTFYMIVKGEVDVFKRATGSQKICTLGPHCFFGERALQGSDTRQATCIASSHVECLTLLRDDFVLMLGNLDDLLVDDKSSLRMSTKIVWQPSMAALLLEEDVGTDLKFSDLKIKRVLGEGAFGKVKLAKSRVDGSLYALKAQSKAFIVDNGQEKNVVREYQMMRELDHTFIVKCYQAFQDNKYVYFLMKLLPGGEVMDLLDERGKFPEKWTRFYCATVVTVLQSMHGMSYAYRDLKPENLVMDEEGYCFIVDFGLTKKIDQGRTWTFCGTPDYLAPEVIRGKGHSYDVDYWALGVLLYELCHGETPFSSDDPTSTAKKIIRGYYETPAFFTPQLTDLIGKLLQENCKRLGRTKGGISRIMFHSWFSGFDWQSLLNRRLDVPWKPKLGKLEKLGTKDSGNDDVPVSDWNPVFN